MFVHAEHQIYLAHMTDGGKGQSLYDQGWNSDGTQGICECKWSEAYYVADAEASNLIFSHEFDTPFLEGSSFMLNGQNVKAVPTYFIDENENLLKSYEPADHPPSAEMRLFLNASGINLDDP